MCATAPRRGPLPKLLWANLLTNSFTHIKDKNREYAIYVFIVLWSLDVLVNVTIRLNGHFYWLLQIDWTCNYDTDTERRGRSWLWCNWHWHVLADRDTTGLARLVDKWSATAGHQSVRLAVVQPPRVGRPSSLGLRTDANTRHVPLDHVHPQLQLHARQLRLHYKRRLHLRDRTAKLQLDQTMRSQL